MSLLFAVFFFFFFNDTATTEIYTLSLHDALPISDSLQTFGRLGTLKASVVASEGRGDAGTETSSPRAHRRVGFYQTVDVTTQRSEEHTSELQSLAYLVCRLLLEKKNKNKHYPTHD